MKTSFVRCMTMVAIVFWVSSAAANSIEVDFGESSDARLTISDKDQSSGGPDQVLFSFTNNGPSSLSGIYIDDSGLLASIDSLYESDGVDFTTDDGTPAGLPSGFSADFALRAQNDADGLNGDREFLHVVFNLNPGVTLTSISEAIIGKDPSFIVKPTFSDPLGTNPVPEPASLILFGIGTAGLAGISRRRRNKK